MGSTSPALVHHRGQSNRIGCGVPPDRRDPVTDSWRAVTWRDCLAAGFVEVRLDGWAVYTPEETAESMLFVLEGAPALVAQETCAPTRPTCAEGIPAST